MKTFSLALAFVAFAMLIGYPGDLPAADEVSKVVAVRGNAFIERDSKEKEARVNDGVVLADRVGTREASRLKLLFLDDSVLTLGEKSQVAMKDYVLTKDDRGRSIFNLLDGKMRAVVGKSAFEVHTPTAIAAARGTVILFQVMIRDGKRCTFILCLEGVVTVSSSSPSIPGSVELTPGMSTMVWEGEPPSSPVPGNAQELLADTNITPDQIRLLDVGRRPIGLGPAFVTGWGNEEFTGASDPGFPLQPVVGGGSSPITGHIIFPPD